MDGSSFDYTPLFRKDGAEPAPRWTGLPKYNFVGGHNDPSQIPIDELIEASATALRREGRTLALYTLGQGPQGHEGVRDFLAGKLARRRGIRATRDDILITIGSGQGLELVNRVLLDPGDTVIVEEFVYFGALAKLKKLGVNIIGLPLDREGLRPDALAEILENLKNKGVRPKYIYAIPTIQNPTGSILSLERRKQLLHLAKEYGVPVFEDECYADLIWDGEAPPSLYALDPDHVIHIGSFSKSLSPALRLGYVVAGWEILGRLIASRTDSPGALEQLVVAEYFNRHFESHMRRMTAALSGKLDTLVEAVEREFGPSVELWRPKGGIYLWLKLPGEVDVRSVVKPAADAGIAFNAGPLWAVDADAAKSFLRLCFALPTKDEIKGGVAALARTFFEHTGISALAVRPGR